MLYICGYNNKKNVNPQSWYALCDETLKLQGTPVEDNIYIYSCEQEAEVEIEDKKAQKEKFEYQKPVWLFEKLQEQMPLARPYTPSRPDDEEDFVVNSPLKDNGYYFKRGLLIHSALQFLPVKSTYSEQVNFINKYLDKNSDNLSKNSVAQIKEEIVKLLKEPECKFIFGPESKAEVPIMGEVDGRIISAQLDRLIVTSDKVIIVDFKTNRPAADSLENVQPGYIKQLNVYKQLLEKIYPNKSVEGYILWTNTAKLMRII